ncbi:MAG: sialate O-acetylesterase [Bacteroidetes bacterium]|nr:sialate O-acetylesterase [Bacteroidota bacterium]
MRNIKIFVFLALFAGLNFQCRSPRLVQGNKEFDVFILMGQSNMSGYGEILPEDTVLVKNIFYLPTIYKGHLQWMPARHPLHNRLPSDRFGMGLPFAKEILATHPGIVVGLIPVAWGGAPIDSLDKGTAVYADALKKALFAETHGGKIKGVLWHQGESDTVDSLLSNSYSKKLQKLVTDLRADLKLPDLPFIVGNLAEFYGTGKEHNAPQRVRQINTIRAALRALPSEMKNTGFVETTGCSSIDSHYVHFNRASYIILGKRYAEKYNEIIAKFNNE